MRLLPTLLAAAWPGMSFAASAEPAVSCPTSIETSQALRSALPSGWEVAQKLEQQGPDIPGKHALIGASLSDGPPIENYILAPVDSRPRKDGRRGYRWNLGRSEDAYLTCTYGHTAIELTLRLEAGLKVCEVLKDPKSGEISATCSR